MVLNRSELPAGLTIVIAAHNEEKVIESTIRNLIMIFSIPNFKPFEIFVSEDGSSDNTRVIVQKLEQIYPEVRLSSESIRLGYSRAIARGIIEANFNQICFIDGDGQTEASDLARLIPHLSQNTVVVGFRSPRSDTKARKIQSYGFNLLFRALGFPKMKDVSAGSIVANTQEILPFANRHLLLDYGFWWEFQAWRERVGIAVVEIPIPHYVRRNGVTQVYRISRISKIASTHIWGLIKLRFELDKIKLNR
jgi:glycosyltransferase involved in cell wall biosynthesis